MLLVMTSASFGQSHFNHAVTLTGRINPKETINAEGITMPVCNFEGLKPLLEQRDGKIYIINFWASWCKPCLEELPYFEKLAQSSHGELVIVLVSVDFRSKAESDLIPFIRKQQLKLPILLLDDPDANSWIEQVSPYWSGAIPATLIYRNEKKEFFEKKFTFEQLEAAVKDFYIEESN